MRTKILVLTACAALALTGCSDDANDRGSAQPPPVDAARNDPGGSTGPVQVNDQGKVVATTKLSVSGGDIELGLVSLSTRGKLADLTLIMTPLTIKPGLIRNSSFWYFNSHDPTSWLLDPVNLKRYNVVKDSNGSLLQTGTVDLAVGKPVTLNYTFAAPPEDVKTIDVQFGDLSPFRNVPISR